MIEKQYIKVKDLKKQAKKNRKSNLSLFNHSHSLKELAKQYNFNSWEELLDNCCLIIEKKEPIELKKVSINKVLNINLRTHSRLL